jgi:hypothetical protein
MSKRWDDLPLWLRWIVGLAIVAVVVLAAWALLVPAADSLARHDVGSATTSRAEHLQTARDAARGRLLTLGAGLFALGALVYTARNYRLSREGHVTDRYTKAIDQLGSDKPEVQIGGIYALERIARDSRRDHPTVMEVLYAFIREHAPERRTSPEDRAPPDVQAAVTVIGRRMAKYDRPEQYVNLRFANLTKAHLEDANLKGADLYGAHLEGAWLPGANLTGANLKGAWLSRAHLTSEDHPHPADFTDAKLAGAHWPAGIKAPEGWERYPADSDRLKPVRGEASESPAS